MDYVFLGYACDILADTNNGLTGSEIIKYCSRYALKYDVIIPVNSIEMLKTTYKPQIPNKRTALLKNISVFNEKQQVIILNELCDLPKFNNNEDVKTLKIKLNRKYSNNVSSDTLNEEQIQETEKCLNNYEKSLKIYKEALEKYHEGIYQRNVLDDMRLSLETLIKELLNNNKSLENQTSDLGKLLKDKNVSNEIRNLFQTLLDYYSKYQNNYVKHNDAIKSNEMELIINQTNIMIQFLVKNLK